MKQKAAVSISGRLQQIAGGELPSLPGEREAAAGSLLSMIVGARA